MNLIELNSILESTPRFALGTYPTPLEPSEGLSRLFRRPVFLKREDLVDPLGSGNKLRRLDYALSAAVESNHRSVLTVGSRRSNQCKAVALAARKLDLKAVLVYGGEANPEPQVLRGNILLAMLSGAEVRRLPYGTSWEETQREAQRLAEQEGHFYLSTGVCEWPGWLGYAAAVRELAAQCRVMSLHRPAVVVPFGTGGTFFGIAVAVELLKLDWQIAAVLTSGTRETVCGRLEFIESSTPPAVRARLPKILEKKYLFTAAAVTPYDSLSATELSRMCKLFRETGVCFEPNYMLKVIVGIEEFVKAQTLDGDRPLVIVHTGGTHALFDLPDRAEQELLSLLRS